MKSEVKSFLFNLFEQRVERLDLNQEAVSLSEASLAFFLEYLYQREKKTIFVILPEENLAERLFFEIDQPESTLFLKERTVLPWEEGRSERGEVEPYFKLKNLVQGGFPFRVFTSFNQALLAFPWNFQPPLKLKKGISYEREELIQKLEEFGYERNYLVEKEGEYAVRGSLIDLYPAGFKPVRLDFLGDTLESIKAFSLSSQRSTEVLETVTVAPFKEAFLGHSEIEKVKKLLPRVPEEEAELLLRNRSFPGWGSYWPYIFKLRNLGTICSPSKSLFVLVEEELIREKSKVYLRWLDESWKRAANKRNLPLLTDKRPFVSLEEVVKGHEQIFISLLGKEKITLALNLDFQKEQRIKKIKSLLKDGYWLVLAGKREYQSQAEKELRENDLTFSSEVKDKGGLFFLPFNLAQSFVFEGTKVACLSLSELFSFSFKAREAAVERPFLVSFELKPGELAVHSRYGIGRYLGMEKVFLDGTYRDYLVLEYADGKLKIKPENFMDLTKYYGGGEGEVKLSSLSSRDWQRKREKARKSARKLAINLVKLYAKRHFLSGFSFSPDTPWQRELEESFLFEETEDQKRAVEEIKRDMESPRVMDRLVFGDVGFGKTEVAIRASFKAVMDGFQVLVLVPTTILAEQHKQTFRERLAHFPLRVEAISRLLSEAEQKKLLRDFSQGKVDILIGTHRLLSSDIKPKKLGLLIIDEEHRFGVAQKEKLKDLYPQVDVLSLSATPIPRTLKMALSGVREVSLIKTPPASRLPVVTFVEPYDQGLIKLAILRELNRGGQVFYLHNRIEELEGVVRNLKELFPEAKLTVVHGKLSEEDLELAMWGFSQGDYDIMVCTTIIEAGLDFPRANTLIVDDSERLGLAQIYQLRGRVGRSDRQAYAYFLYDPVSLTSAGWERLKAVAELSDLGSGLKLALKDLQIRGAGTLFGPEQHGHIRAVGFDLYTQLIEEAVSELKGEAPKPRAVLLESGLSAFIPESYLADERLRLELYHRLAEVESEQEIKDLKEEVIDRFGPPPQEVLNLFEAVEVRLLAEKLGLKEVKVRKEGMVLKGDEIDKLVKAAPASFVFEKRFNRLILKCPADSIEEKMSYLKSFLNGIILKVMKVG